MYRELMTRLGQGIGSGAGLLLQPEALPQLGFGQPLQEYGERLCSILAAFGPQVALLSNTRAGLLQQVTSPCPQHGRCVQVRACIAAS